MSDLAVIGKRLYASAYRIIVGPIEGGTTVSEAPDPRDEEIAALKQQLADRDAADAAAHDKEFVTAPGEAVGTGTGVDTTPAAETDGDAIIAEAKRRLEAGEGLDNEHVRAIEHPEEFAGKTVAAPDTGIAPTA